MNKWTDEEISLIMAREHRDDELAKMLHRSIDTIRTKRYTIRNPAPPKPPVPKYANGICNETCPDYCPYKDCRMSGASILMAQYRKKVKS
ncbi:MAG: hypothetical protein IJY28_00570 [Clostridia bacterium]|nr:hypothetical protein [Clostridia bacterium]